MVILRTLSVLAIYHVYHVKGVETHDVKVHRRIPKPSQFWDSDGKDRINKHESLGHNMSSNNELSSSLKETKYSGRARMTQKIKKTTKVNKNNAESKVSKLKKAKRAKDLDGNARIGKPNKSGSKEGTDTLESNPSDVADFESEIINDLDESLVDLPDESPPNSNTAIPSGELESSSGSHSSLPPDISALIAEIEHSSEPSSNTHIETESSVMSDPLIKENEGDLADISDQKSESVNNEKESGDSASAEVPPKVDIVTASDFNVEAGIPETGSLDISEEELEKQTSPESATSTGIETELPPNLESIGTGELEDEKSVQTSTTVDIMTPADESKFDDGTHDTPAIIPELDHSDVNELEFEVEKSPEDASEVSPQLEPLENTFTTEEFELEKPAFDDTVTQTSVTEIAEAAANNEEIFASEITFAENSSIPDSNTNPNGELNFGFEFITAEESLATTEEMSTSNDNSIDFEFVFETPTSSTTPTEEDISDISCPNLTTETGSKTTIEYFYMIETSNDDIGGILTALEKKMMTLVADEVCSGSNNRHLSKRNEQAMYKEFDNDHSNNVRRLEVVKIESAPRDEILPDLCIPEEETNTCTHIRGEMTAYFTEEGLNGNADLVQFNVILALKFAMKQGTFIDSGVGIHKVTFVNDVSPIAEISQAISTPAVESKRNVPTSLKMGLAFFALLAMLLLFSIAKRRREYKYALHDDKDSEFIDFETNSSSSETQSKRIMQEDLYSIKTITEEENEDSSINDSDYEIECETHVCTSNTPDLGSDSGIPSRSAVEIVSSVVEVSDESAKKDTGLWA